MIIASAYFVCTRSKGLGYHRPMRPEDSPTPGRKTTKVRDQATANVYLNPCVNISSNQAEENNFFSFAVLGIS